MKITGNVDVWQDDDYTVIPVKIMEDNQVSFVIEEGILAECYHIHTMNFGKAYDNCLNCGEAVEKGDIDESDEWRDENDCF